MIQLDKITLIIYRKTIAVQFLFFDNDKITDAIKCKKEIDNLAKTDKNYSDVWSEIR